MKLICDQKDISFALNIVNRAVSTNNTLPVLNNIYLKAVGKKLYLYATNLEVAITCTVDAEVLNEGEITIPARVFTGYVNLLSDGKVEFKLDPSNQVLISTKNSNTKINGLGTEDFPALPKIEKEIEFFVDAAKLKKGIEQTAFASSSNMARPVLSGVLFDLNKNILKLVATDSYRLAEKTIKLDQDYSKNITCVLPAHTVLELAKVLSSGVNDKVKVLFSKNQVLFEYGDIQLFSRVIEGSFPDYEKILPRSHKTIIEVPVSDFVQAAKRINILVANGNNNVKISVTNDGKMLLASGENYIGEGKVELDVRIKGENNKISLNSQYLLDVLQAIEGETAVFELDSKMTPGLIRSQGKETDYRHIIMPLKV